MTGFPDFIQQLPMPLLILGTISLWILEPLAAEQPLPANRHTHGRNNLVVAVINLATLVPLSGVIIAATQIGKIYELGIFPAFGITGLPAFLLGLIGYDLVNYGIHRSLHQFPFLWRWHRGHHTDNYLDVTSAFRFHPGESVYRTLIFSIYVAVAGIGLEVVLTYQVWVILALLVSHTNLKVSERIYQLCKWFIVLPSIHRGHHSKSRSEHDSNYGIGSVFWDHLFRTYTSPHHVKNLEIGLAGYENPSHQRVISILKDPLQHNRL